MRIRTRSRRPSPSLSTSDSTKTVSSIEFANGNTGCVTPFSTLSLGGGIRSCAAAGAAETDRIAAPKAVRARAAGDVKIA
jgi:hypothetical protein